MYEVNAKTHTLTENEHRGLTTDGYGESTQFSCMMIILKFKLYTFWRNAAAATTTTYHHRLTNFLFYTHHTTCIPSSAHTAQNIHANRMWIPVHQFRTTYSTPCTGAYVRGACTLHTHRHRRHAFPFLYIIDFRVISYFHCVTAFPITT